MEIQYIVHSCFVLKEKDTTLVFDYPGGRYMDAQKKKAVASAIQGKRAVFLVSHSHGDHYSRDIFSFAEDEEDIHYVLSDDVCLHKEHSSITKLGPGEKHTLDDIDIQTFKSNDQGVAFLLEMNGRKIYYGGDLAKWDWPEWSEKKRREHVSVFDETLDILKEKDIDVAFSNMDERLSSWAGPVEFIEAVKPEVFVPMHTFENEGWVDDLIEEIGETDVKIFNYDTPGDTLNHEF